MFSGDVGERAARECGGGPAEVWAAQDSDPVTQTLLLPHAAGVRVVQRQGRRRQLGRPVQTHQQEVPRRPLPHGQGQPPTPLLTVKRQTSSTAIYVDF